MKKESEIKRSMSNWQKEKLHNKLIKDTNLSFSNDEYVLIYGMGNFYTYNRLKKENPNTHFFCLEDDDISYMLRKDKNVYYTNSSDISCVFETILEILRDNNIMKFSKIIMNPPYNRGGQIWNTCRKLTNETVCLMPINKYKDDEGFRYVKDEITVSGKTFNDARITQDLYITYCDNSKNNYKTYEDFYLSIIINDNPLYKDFYLYNKKNDKGIYLSEKRNAPIKYFKDKISFVTINRCCSRDNNFSSLNGTDFKYNHEGKRDFTDEEWPTNLASMQFITSKALNNFNSFVYDNENSKKLINNAMWGLNLDIVSKKTKYAIPQIDWEAISDHPLWIEGKLDIAVLDVMGLKWNDTMDGVVKK